MLMKFNESRGIYDTYCFFFSLNRRVAWPKIPFKERSVTIGKERGIAIKRNPVEKE